MAPVQELDFVPISYVEGTDISSAATFTPPATANKMLIQSKTQALYFTLDGTTATSTNGFYLPADEFPKMVPLGRNEGGVLPTISAIQAAATARICILWGK